MLSTFINLPFVIQIFVLSILEWPFYTGLTLCFKLAPAHFSAEGSQQFVLNTFAFRLCWHEDALGILCLESKT